MTLPSIKLYLFALSQFAKRKVPRYKACSLASIPKWREITPSMYPIATLSICSQYVWRFIWYVNTNSVFSSQGNNTCFRLSTTLSMQMACTSLPYQQEVYFSPMATQQRTNESNTKELNWRIVHLSKGFASALRKRVRTQRNANSDSPNNCSDWLVLSIELWCKSRSYI